MSALTSTFYSSDLRCFIDRILTMGCQAYPERIGKPMLCSPTFLQMQRPRPHRHQMTPLQNTPRRLVTAQPQELE